MIDDESEIAKNFNEYFVNIIKNLKNKLILQQTN